MRNGAIGRTDAVGSTAGGLVRARTDRIELDIELGAIGPIEGERGGADAGDFGPTFDEFYAAHYRRAVSMAWALSGSREAAEDLVQDAMADAHRRWPTIAEYDAPALWLRRAVVNRSVSLRRRLAARARGLARLESRAGTDALDAASDDHVNARDAQLWATVRRLPSRQGQLVALVYVEGLAVTDAAAVLGVAVPTAKTHLVRARRRLAHDLAAWREPIDQGERP